jgi:DNA-binding GntR family transcriptional regulator
MIKRNVSLSEQVKKELISMIGSGEIVSAEGKLPSEADLSELFEVSRSTIRIAMASLEDSGLIDRQQGIGTYIKDLVIPQNTIWDLQATATYDDGPKSFVSQVKTNVISLDFVKVGSSDSALKLHPEDSAIRVIKVIDANEKPVIYSDTKVPLRAFKGDPPDLEEIRKCCIVSIYELLHKHSKHSFRHQVTRITSLLAKGVVAKHLKYEVGQPLLSFEDIGLSIDNTPLFHGINHFRPDYISFQTVRKPIMSINTDQN